MGSGIWYNTGKTAVFVNHLEAHARFCGKCQRPWADSAMSINAAKEGFDTIQFLKHPDDQWRCINTPGTNGIMNLEIVVVKGMGHGDLGACGTDPHLFKTGWNADQFCDCDKKEKHLNCHGRRRSSAAADIDVGAGEPKYMPTVV